MAYVHRVVKAGPCVEHKKMQSFRVHTKGVKRGPNTGHTTEKQERINERVAEEHLRWDINANFGHRDLHAVLHYYVKDSSFEEVLENKAAFLRNLRKLCKKRGITFKAVVVIETKRMTNPHIHVIISRMDPEIITEAWENVPRGGGGISFKPTTTPPWIKSWRTSATGNCWRNTWPGSSSGQGRTGGIIAPEKFGRFWTIDRAILIAWKAAQG